MADVQIAPLLNGLPGPIRDKIGKTLQTRGAQPSDRVPYQNRVNRNGVAVVPYRFRSQLPPEGFENGYRIMVRPSEYFTGPGEVAAGFDRQVVIGGNAFVYYDNRHEWAISPLLAGWVPCDGRGPGRGHYLARVPGTTAADPDHAGQIVRGEPQGIRFFEYASSETMVASIAQLAWMAWMTDGIGEVRTGPMPAALTRHLARYALDDLDRLAAAGAVELRQGGPRSMCPLCLEPIRARGLMTRLEQVAGREVVDQTVTEVNLFHLRDLKPGEYNHRPYLLAWGHHHCNTVARDIGVDTTVAWMRGVVARHDARGAGQAD